MNFEPIFDCLECKLAYECYDVAAAISDITIVNSVRYLLDNSMSTTAEAKRTLLSLCERFCDEPCNLYS
jgi:hypothetical protein